ncbi:hypothetical protein QJS04_geneDACA017282 [Acorus gramineus]|uniref:Uncharacterized protein n=1 Tax=Acorus gramineus TaxID=55184 RepID=A0AAV9A2V3_ACOGR|nr:hypothetical protein QJS04_geneDACA017282 [Acorus gramineus]
MLIMVYVPVRVCPSLVHLKPWRGVLKRHWILNNPVSELGEMDSARRVKGHLCEASSLHTLQPHIHLTEEILSPLRALIARPCGTPGVRRLCRLLMGQGAIVIRVREFSIVRQGCSMCPNPNSFVLLLYLFEGQKKVLGPFFGLLCNALVLLIMACQLEGIR